jgi:hypothetical protein
MLESMISPGGPMSRFAGTDAKAILSWIGKGALEKPITPAPGAATQAINAHTNANPINAHTNANPINAHTNANPVNAHVTPAAFWNFGLHPNTGGQNTYCGPQGRKPFVVDVPPEKITYSNTIKFIVAKNCLECHSGKFRNLASYGNLRFYADSGLLKKLIIPGGEMHRFSGPDTQTFNNWIINGTPK